MDNLDTVSGPALSQFSFCKLIVDDLDGMAVFYRQVFGVTDWARVTKEISATTGGPIDEITFRPAANGGPSLTLLKLLDTPAPPRGEVVLGFITSSITALLDRAVASGGRIATPAEAQPEHDIKVAFIEDPEGHLIEIIEMT